MTTKAVASWFPSHDRGGCGRWVRSDDSLVYRYHSHNIVDGLPDDHDFEYILGVDLGYHDATAFVIMAYSRDLPYVFRTTLAGILDCHLPSLWTRASCRDTLQRVGCTCFQEWSSDVD